MEPRRDRDVTALVVGVVHDVTAVGRLDVRDDMDGGAVELLSGAGGSRPQTSQKPSSIFPPHPVRGHLSI
ncbi:hypothetical protein [Actinocrispum wychmicini]|uniref:hypothetical protein n=1 Tax=Actinocrispum wychmicini TaxID=1213861 RepID=UPI003C7BB717